MRQLTVVIPTYNEADNLAALTAELWALALPGLRILIVDDGSPDGTGELAEDLASRQPDRMSVIHRQGKLGLGTAYITGFKQALADGAEAIAQMDADFSHSPDYLPDFVAQLDEYDAVFGSRYVPGGSLDERWGIGRLLLSAFGNFYARTILGLKVMDATGGFRAWRRETLAGMPLDDIRSNGYVFQVEMAFVAQRLGYRIVERPIYFEDRRIGQSKMSFRIQIEAALRVWQVLMMHRHLTPQSRRPLE
ncbi:MAG: polyprenol monophosphomannose synthase [Anaerolineales bacterium]|jgi:dolichol-phosphate mannosyltransferase